MSGLILRNVLPILIMSLFYLLPLAITKKHVVSNRIFRASLPPILAVWYGSWEWFLAGLLIIAPSIIKGWVFGDDVEEVKKAQDVGHSGAGAV
jgi:hypothetical protein